MKVVYTILTVVIRQKCVLFWPPHVCISSWCRSTVVYTRKHYNIHYMLYRRYIILLYTDNNHQQKYYIRYTLQRELRERYYSYTHHCRVDVYTRTYTYTSYIYTFFSQIHVGKQLARKCTYIYLNIQIYTLFYI